jgi:Zn-dependent M28 family amino/carboxypeptidase
LSTLVVLVAASTMATVKPANIVRFTWWGVEASGLLGFEHYVADLTEEEADDKKSSAWTRLL